MQRSHAKKIIFVGIGLLVLAGLLQIGTKILSRRTVSGFESCVARGFPVLELYPRQCRTPDGKTFTEDIGNELEKDNFIRIASPRPNEVVASPLQVRGVARGSWFFEASFPIELRDANGNVLVSHYASVEGEWMTEEFVPFTATLRFTSPGGHGTLILRKDNPSGLPEHDDALVIPVRFASPSNSSLPDRKSACRPTGCSGQVCSDEDMVTTCEARPEYACYKEPFAVCERQSTGECGWTETRSLTACLEHSTR